MPDYWKDLLLYQERIRRIIQVIRQDPYQEAINDVQKKLDDGGNGGVSHCYTNDY